MGAASPATCILMHVELCHATCIHVYYSGLRNIEAPGTRRLLHSTYLLNLWRHPGACAICPILHIELFAYILGISSYVSVIQLKNAQECPTVKILLETQFFALQKSIPRSIEFDWRS